MTKLHLDPLPGFKPFPGPVVLVIMDGVGSGQARRIGRRLPGEHAGARRAARRAAVRLQLKAHGKAVGLPVRRGHGQLRGGAQRARRRPGLRPGRAAGERRDRLGRDLRGRRLAGGRRARQPPAGRSTSSACSPTATSTATSSTCSRCSTGARTRASRACACTRCSTAATWARGARSTYIDALEDRLAQLNGAAGRDYRIASGGGRMVTTMDRYGANWGVVERGWKAHVLGVGPAVSRRPARPWRRTTARIPRSTDQYLDSFVIESRTASRSERSRTATPSSSSTSAATAPSRSRARSRRRTSTEFDRVRAPGRLLRGHDAVRRRRADPEAVPRRAAGHRPHRVAVPVRRRRYLVRHLRDPEVRPRHLFLERQQLRLHRREPREVRRDPVRQGARSTSGRG